MMRLLQCGHVIARPDDSEDALPDVRAGRWWCPLCWLDHPCVAVRRGFPAHFQMKRAIGEDEFVTLTLRAGEEDTHG